MVLPVLVLFPSGETALQRDLSDTTSTKELQEILAVELRDAHAWQLELIHDQGMLPKTAILADAYLPQDREAGRQMELQLVRRARQEYEPYQPSLKVSEGELSSVPKVTLVFYGVGFHALSQLFMSIKRFAIRGSYQGPSMGGHETCTVHFQRSDQKTIRLELRHLLPKQEGRLPDFFFDGADGILLPFSLHYSSSFDQALASMRYIDSLETLDARKIQRVLLGTHLHMHGKSREITSREALQVAHSRGYSYHEVFSNSLRNMEDFRGAGHKEATILERFLMGEL
ncbi:unnamed protein product [Cladocopium goreaui]|uniref:Uncharacterized protein n=1 Tax=Cladocopium goreaui TaxID=2562237 RepID=A0A9P1GCM2_9DINO|nr:unnamed protein product [Cladocopium goreaui]